MGYSIHEVLPYFHTLTQQRSTSTSKPPQVSVEAISLLSPSSSSSCDDDPHGDDYFSEKRQPDSNQHNLLSSSLHHLRALTPHAQQLLQLLKTTLIFLLPSPLTTSLHLTTAAPLHTLPPRRRTSYLDGLRGLAALVVFHTHLAAVLTRFSGGVYTHDSGTHNQLYKLPFLNLLYKGDFAVCLFFVISGFASSISPIAHMNAPTPNPSLAFSKLAASAFRRPFRLFLPSLASMLLVFVLIRLDYFGAIQRNIKEYQTLVHGWSPVMNHWPVRLESVWAQLLDFAGSCLGVFGIMAGAGEEGFGVPYNTVLWTIKLEFRASIVLAFTHAALFFVRARVRRVVAFALVVLALASLSFELPLFFGGYFIAECDAESAADARAPLLPSTAPAPAPSPPSSSPASNSDFQPEEPEDEARDPAEREYKDLESAAPAHSTSEPSTSAPSPSPCTTRPVHPPSTPSTRSLTTPLHLSLPSKQHLHTLNLVRTLRTLRTPAIALLSLFSLYLGSFPNLDPDRTPLYSWLTPVTPLGQRRLWVGIGSIVFVHTTTRLALPQRVARCAAAQYLGVISFAMYLVHYWLVTGLGEVLFYGAWSATGTRGVRAYVGFAGAYLLLLACVVWVADVFTRAVVGPGMVVVERVRVWCFRG